MTDRELLELAAKVYGVNIWADIDGNCYSANGVGAAERFWNPLTDDGDALRLAVKLKLTVQNGCSNDYGRIFTLVCHYPDTGEPATVAIKMFSEDPYAATRRAIVRAAAEIGRNMK